MKPARYIEDLHKRLESSASLLTRLTAELAAWPAKAAAMVEAALVNTRADHAAAAELDRERIRQLGVECCSFARERDELKTRVAGLQHRLIAASANATADADRIRVLEGQLSTRADLDAEFDRRSKVVEAARSELEELVGAVRDRMRRREQEQADAALNRAAIAAAVPGFRRSP